MNTLKTTVLMAALMGILIAIGGAVGGTTGALLMFVISLGMNIFMYWNSADMCLRAYGAREVTREDAPNLYDLVERLAKRAELPMPRVCIIEADEPNAFATGRNPEHAAVAVTTGIMRALNYEELAGVISHELAHVKHRDILISTIAASMAGAISMIANVAQFGAILAVATMMMKKAAPIWLLYWQRLLLHRWRQVLSRWRYPVRANTTLMPKAAISAAIRCI